jgi:hypothetical protein
MTVDSRIENMIRIVVPQKPPSCQSQLGGPLFTIGISPLTLNRRTLRVRLITLVLCFALADVWNRVSGWYDEATAFGNPCVSRLASRAGAKYLRELERSTLGRSAWQPRIALRYDHWLWSGSGSNGA